MIKIGSAISTSDDPAQAVDEVIAQSLGELDGFEAGLAFAFISADHGDGVDEIVKRLAARLDNVPLVGCTTQTTIGKGSEVEQGPALALWVAHLSGATVTPFSAAIEQTPDGAALVGFPIIEEPVQAAFLLADPYTFPTQVLLQTLNEDYPQLPVFGGQASGAGAGQVALVLQDRILREGAVGILLSGNVEVTPLVSQGCRPIGEPYVVTSAKGNVIQELGGKPPLGRLREIMSKLSQAERAQAAHNLHIGVVIDERKADPEPGDFLIRPVLQADPETGAVSVGEVLNVGQTVQFQVRDAEAADADLKNMLKTHLGGAPAPDVTGALLFTCNGRGSGLFGVPDHDVSVLRDAIPDLPVAGMFCGGEIGPIGGVNFLHGFTASIALFRETH